MSGGALDERAHLAANYERPRETRKLSLVALPSGPSSLVPSAPASRYRSAASRSAVHACSRFSVQSRFSATLGKARRVHSAEILPRRSEVRPFISRAQPQDLSRPRATWYRSPSRRRRSQRKIMVSTTRSRLALQCDVHTSGHVAANRRTHAELGRDLNSNASVQFLF